MQFSQRERLTNSTYAGLRPVVDTGKANPSKESREHAIWDENDLLTVSGGKLTTFRIMARDALEAVRRHLGYIPFKRETPVLEPIPHEGEALLANSSLSRAAPAVTGTLWNLVCHTVRLRFFLQSRTCPGDALSFG